MTVEFLGTLSKGSENEINFVVACLITPKHEKLGIFKS